MKIKTAADWDTERLAAYLHGHREELLARLPRVIGGARRISSDERELILDEAIEFIALAYAKPIRGVDELERVLWDACTMRTLNALNGRYATVRNGFERASEETLENLAHQAEPADEVERTQERQILREFVALLSVSEAAVLRCKHLSGTSDPLGYRQVAKLLDIPSARARALERSIARKLDDFAATLAAGKLCGQRHAALSADAAGTASDLQGRLARAHLKHCAPCKMGYVAQLRELSSAEFGRKVASLLPVGPAAGAGERGGGVRDLLADWAGRAAGHDPTATTAQLVASGAGRGAGGVLGVKIAACLTGGVATIGACIATGVIDWPTRTPSQTDRAAPAKTATPVPTRTPDPIATPRATATPTASAKRRKGATAKTQGGTSPSSHEQPPASPAPAGSLPNGQSEFTPGSTSSAPAPPAPAPAAPGASEFP